MGKVTVVGGKVGMNIPLAGIKASELAVGSSVYIMENGSPIEYLVVNQGIPSGSNLYDKSCDGVWLLRKDIYGDRQWHSSNNNDYKNSTIHSYLNSTFFNLFGEVEKAVIKRVKIPYVNGTAWADVASGAEGLDTSVFLLSGTEVGFSGTHIPKDEGAILDYFEEGDGTSSWWLRSPSTASALVVGVVYNGGWVGSNASNGSGVRPALILPNTSVFDEETLLLKGVA